MYKNSKKNAKNQGMFHNLQLHLVCQYIKMWVLTRHRLCECLIKICVSKRKCRRNLDEFRPSDKNYHQNSKFKPIKLKKYSNES